MANNAQKTPFAVSMSRFAEKKIADRLALSGKSLPASVVSVKPGDGIVTINFEIQSDFTLPHVTVPVAMSRYLRIPIQPGDKGVVLSMDTFIGGITGLGAATAVLSLPPSNLSALVFMPVGNLNWSAVLPGSVFIDNPAFATKGNAIIGTGATGSFTTPTGQTVTVQDGIIVNIF